ncbi:hypothetical protein [Herbaspirillum sp. CAH-3]|jgi:hypothetical protein|uniref:hypothetical protein n=1 Tax=Herbaspirillum sp. CAH-3 TaxID=2605746 RepID=UPI0012AD0C6D|nr:hypothetical protein [Herbaspirillum sp. CAH-3]MRT30428.1 hypothetical protein [Herbaspirillum sp. CAH-3]
MAHVDVQKVVAILQREFSGSSVTFTDDGSGTGGGWVIIDPVTIGDRYTKNQTWMGAHLNGLLPFADIYPLYIGSDVQQASGAGHFPAITPGHNFQGKAALQVSKRTNHTLVPTAEAAAMKFIKVLHYIKEGP